MMMDTNSILLVAALCVVIGFLVGGLVSSVGKKPEADESKKDKKAVLKIWRNPRRQNLMVELDGKVYEQPLGLNARQRSLVGQILMELHTWLEGEKTSRLESVTARIPQTTEAEAVGADKAEPRLSLNPVNMLANALRADVPLSQLPTESIVGQIDAILQEKLRDSALRGEGIRLMEWPGVGMVVMVGMDRYDSVEEVPNPAIQALIRAAVVEWEQRGLDG